MARQPSSAFTLIELLVVIAIVAITTSHRALLRQLSHGVAMLIPSSDQSLFIRDGEPASGGAALRAAFPNPPGAARRAAPPGHRAGIAGATVACLLVLAGCISDEPPRPAAAPGHFCADLAAAANLGFADDRPGDGIGGWSDQGRENSFAEFDVARTDFGGVPFHITDPATNHGKAIVSFRHASLPAAPVTVTLPLPARTRGRYLYLLHTSCWNGLPTGEVVGTATVNTRDARVHPLVIQAGREVADWWNPSPLDNGRVVVAKPNASALVGVYLSRFDLGAEVEAANLTFTTSGKALWILLGATLTVADIPLPTMQGLTISASSEWKTLTDTDLAIKPGTALDCSSWLDHAPAGARGRVIARPDGALAFSDEPAKAVRFFSCSLDVVKLPKDEATIELIAEAVRLQGYNMVRMHFLDLNLGGGYAKWGAKPDPAALADFDRRAAAGEPIFEPAVVAMVDRYVAALRRRGIYICLDAMSSWTGFYPVNPYMPDRGGVRDIGQHLYVDASARRHWRDCVRALLTRINPLTGTSFATDPQVVAIVGYNEQDFRFSPKDGPPAIFLKPWRDFLAKRFADAAAWRAAWGASDPGVAIDTAPLFAMTDVWHSRRMRIVADFLHELEMDTNAWMLAELRSFGYQGLYSNFDWLKSLHLYLPRSEQGMSSMHGYYAHPSNGAQPGSTAVQVSALSDALNWWRGITGTRIAGQPFAVLEYGQVYWNRYRYEEGLSVGAYAAFQDLSILTAHCMPVSLKPRQLGPFRVGPDPIARASQVVTGLIFMGRTVASAPHRVDIQLSRDQALDRAEFALSGDQTRIGLLTGLAVAVEGRTPAVAASLQIPLGDGARTVSTQWVSGVEDSDGGSLAGTVAALRRKGVLAPGNRSDPARGVFESETSEILLDARGKRLLVHGPALAGICAEAGSEAQQAGALAVDSASVAASITVASRDQRPPAELAAPAAGCRHRRA